MKKDGETEGFPKLGVFNVYQILGAWQSLTSVWQQDFWRKSLVGVRERFIFGQYKRFDQSIQKRSKEFLKEWRNTLYVPLKYQSRIFGHTSRHALLKYLLMTQDLMSLHPYLTMKMPFQVYLNFFKLQLLLASNLQSNRLLKYFTKKQRF